VHFIHINLHVSTIMWSSSGFQSLNLRNTEILIMQRQYMQLNFSSHSCTFWKTLKMTAWLSKKVA